MIFNMNSFKIPKFISREKSMRAKFWEFTNQQKLIHPKNLNFSILENTFMGKLIFAEINLVRILIFCIEQI